MGFFDDVATGFNNAVDNLTNEVLESFSPETSQEKGNQTAAQVEMGDFGTTAVASINHVNNNVTPVLLIAGGLSLFLLINKF